MVTVNHHWRKYCTAEGRASVMGEMLAPWPWPWPLLPDGKWQVEASIVGALEMQNKEVKAELIELETVQVIKTKDLIATSRGKQNCLRELWQTWSQKIHYWWCWCGMSPSSAATLKGEQLNDCSMWQIVQKMEARRSLEWTSGPVRNQRTLLF